MKKQATQTSRRADRPMQKHWVAKTHRNARIFLWAGFILSPALLSAQAVSSINSEKLPTTRDPSYVAPLVSEELRLGQDSAAALAIFGQNDGLETFLKDRRESALRKKRETGRFREREDERMLRQGHGQALLEGILQEDFGPAGFPKNMGRYPYRESKARRFSVIFLLALPVTGGLSFGAIAAYKSANGGEPSFSNTESILGGVLSIGAALGIAVYDSHRIAEWQKSHESWPPPLKTRNGMIEKEESDLPASTQGLLFAPKAFPSRSLPSEADATLFSFQIQVKL